MVTYLITGRIQAITSIKSVLVDRRLTLIIVFGTNTPRVEQAELTVTLLIVSTDSVSYANSRGGPVTWCKNYAKMIAVPKTELEIGTRVR